MPNISSHVRCDCLPGLLVLWAWAAKLGIGSLAAAAATGIDDFEYGLTDRVISSPLDNHGWTMVSGGRLDLVTLPGSTTPNGTRFAAARLGGASATRPAPLNGSQHGFSLEADFVAQFNSPNVSLALATGDPAHPTFGPSFGITPYFNPDTFQGEIHYFVQAAGGETVYSTFEAALVWIRLRLVIDPTAFDGNGAGFLFGQASFTDGEMFPIPGLQNVPLKLLNGGGAPPASWNMVYMGLDSFCLMDNIRATTGPIARLWALEVTQSIQDWFNRVPLIEGKETYVRAFLEAVTPGDVGRVIEGKLRGFRDGIPLPESPLSPMESSSLELPAQARLERPKFNGSLNFELPKEWTSNSVTLRLEVDELALEDGPLAGQGGPRSGAVSVNFQSSARPKVGLIPMGLSLPLGPSHPPPSADEMAQVVEWIRRMYPVAELDVDWGQPVTFFYPIPPGPSDLFALVMTERSNNPTWADENRIALGFITPETWEASFAGDVAGMGGYLGMDAAWFVASVDLISGFQTTAAHELGHVLGRPHPVSPEFGGVPGVRLGACGEIILGSVETFPWFAPMNCTGAPVAGNKPNLGEMGLGEPDKIYGFEPVMHPALVANNIQESVLNPDCYFEMMSYCEFTQSWISEHSYKRLLEAIRNEFGGPAAARFPKPRPAAPGPGHLLVSGFIDRGTDVVTWRPVQRLEQGSPSVPSPNAPYSLEVLDAAGAVLSSIPFDAQPLPDADRTSQPESAPFFLTLPADAAIRRFAVRHDGQVLSTIAASANPPTVKLLAPNGGEVLDAATFEIRWEVSDADGDAVRHRVEYSPDDGGTWHVLAVDVPTNRVAISTAELPGSAQARIRVWANDGFLSSDDISDAVFQVPDKGPVLVMLQPADGERFLGDAPIRFQAIVFDREEGRVPANQLEWRSDLHGLIGTGEEVFVKSSRLPPGTHQITLTGRDSAGHVSETRRQIIVTDVAAPRLRLVSGPSVGNAVLGVIGIVPSRTVIESSENLLDWQLVESRVQRQSEEQVIDPNAPGTENRFYRARSTALEPSVVKQPSSVARLPGSDIEFQVKADGTFPRYEWRFNGTPLPGANGPSLRLPNAGLNQSGLYQVVIRNSASVVTSAPVHVTVMAETYEVVHQFGTNALDGINGWGRLTLGRDGWIYGCARNGAISSNGVAYKMRRDGGGFTVLHRFQRAADGGNPLGGVIEASDGQLYGTCNVGGTSDAGTVWRLNTDGSGFAVLRHFLSTGDCRNPEAELLEAGDGRLYGTAYNGGGSGRGGVFALDKDGSNYSVLSALAFGGNAAPKSPIGGLIEGPDGMLYGTTEFGGNADKGTVFKLSRDGQTRSIIASLGAVAEGAANPACTLLLGSNGLLYGTTYSGGVNGAGTVFRLGLDGGSFGLIASLPGGADGLSEPRAGLVETPFGTLLGTTRIGGSANQGGIFRLLLDGTSLINFRSFTSAGGDGARARGPLLRVPGGVYYGTTFAGGSQGRGTVFRFIQPDP